MEKARRDAIEQERIEKEKEAKRIAEQERLKREAENRALEERSAAKKRKAEFEMLKLERDSLILVIEQNRGLFGEKARKRKYAKAKLIEVEAKIKSFSDLA